MRADVLSPGLRLMAPSFEEMAASIYLADIRGSEGTVAKRVPKTDLVFVTNLKFEFPGNSFRCTSMDVRKTLNEVGVEVIQVEQVYGSGVGAEGEHEQVDDENWSDYSGVVFMMKALMRGQAFHVVGPA